jgi:hypothetical protein
MIKIFQRGLSSEYHSVTFNAPLRDFSYEPSGKMYEIITDISSVVVHFEK